jgi:Xaa-Pro dipeptidase
VANATIFTEEEYGHRLAATRALMAERQLDALLVFSPENIYYLTGLNHQGYFAFTMLVVTPDGPLTIVTRSMERATIASQAPSAAHETFHDDEEPVDVAVRVVRERGLDETRLGIERTTMFLPISIYVEMRQELDAVEFVDGSDIIEGLRAVKSPSEIDCIRRAAALSDRAIRAGIMAAGVGINEREVAAAIYRSMVLGGSEYPGFAPLVRSTEFLRHEHTTWRDRVLVPSDGLFMELSASVERYHAPITRMIHVGRAPPGVERSAVIVIAALDAAVDAARPGAHAGDVYAAWQRVIDEELGHDRYRRHHCGYMVGIGFPPSWVGGSAVVGLRPGGELELRAGMAFHVLSWLLGTEHPDYGVSDTVLVTADGGELLTSTSREALVIN